VSAGGVLAPGSDSPGAGIGTLNLTGLTLSDGARFKLEIGAVSSDVASVNGAVTLTGDMPLEILLPAQPLEGMTFTFLLATGGITGFAEGARFSFLGNSLDNGEIFTVNGDFTQAFSISYGADTVALTAVPEPGGAAALLGGFGLLLGIARSRRCWR
jgi:hypothetical protein